MPYFLLHLFGGQAHAHVDLRQMIHHPGIGSEFVAGHRNHAERFGAAGDDDLRAAGADAIRRHGDGLQSRMNRSD